MAKVRSRCGGCGRKVCSWADVCRAPRCSARFWGCVCPVNQAKRYRCNACIRRKGKEPLWYFLGITLRFSLQHLCNRARMPTTMQREGTMGRRGPDRPTTRNDTRRTPFVVLGLLWMALVWVGCFDEVKDRPGVTTQNCTTDRDCFAGEICDPQSDTCVSSGCRNDSDCPETYACNSSVC